MKGNLSADVLVLGGGPAGLMAAQECAARGLRTLVVEKKKEIGSPIQTSGATYIREIRRYGIPSSFCHRVGYIRFLSSNEEARFRNLDEGIGVLDIRGMLQHMAKQAVEKGARFYLGTRALEPLVSKGWVQGAVVQTPQGAREKISALVTLDATGLASVTARRLFGFPGFRRYGLGLEYDLYAPGWPQEELVLLAGSEVAPTGYGWIFPWGGHRVRVGVGVTFPDARGVDLQGCLNRLIEDDVRFAPFFSDSGCIELHKGFIPDELFPRQPAAHGLLIIGDAAGQASALAGEGIRFAMEMGVLAAKATVQAVKKGMPKKELLGKAHEQWNKRHGRNFRIAMEINRRMADFNDEQWDKAIRYLDRLSDRQFLQFLKTDFSLSLFLRVLAKYPDLARKALFRRVLKELK